MKPFALLLACILAVASLAACESDGDAPPPVAAEDQTGDYFRETETEDLTVRIEIPAAARTTPGLGDRLIADAEAEAADAARRAAERRRERPSGFTPSQLIITWTVAYDDGGVLSLSGLTRSYDGVVEESRMSLLYDRAAGRELTVADLFGDPRPGGPGMTALAEAAFISWTEVSPSVRGRELALVDEYALSSARETLRSRASSFPAFVLVPPEADRTRVGGIDLFYPEGQLGPRTEGPFTLFVPAAAIAAHLKPEWQARLASEPDLED